MPRFFNSQSTSPHEHTSSLPLEKRLRLAAHSFGTWGLAPIPLSGAAHFFCFPQRESRRGSTTHTHNIFLLFSKLDSPLILPFAIFGEAISFTQLPFFSIFFLPKDALFFLALPISSASRGRPLCVERQPLRYNGTSFAPPYGHCRGHRYTACGLVAGGVSK